MSIEISPAYESTNVCRHPSEGWGRRGKQDKIVALEKPMFCREVRHKQTHKQTRQFELLRGATMEIESVVQNDTGCFPGYVIKGDL